MSSDHTTYVEAVAASNLTIEAIAPVAAGVKQVLSGAIDQVNRLQGQPIEIILAPIIPGNPLITIEELAALVSELLHVCQRSLYSTAIA